MAATKNWLDWERVILGSSALLFLLYSGKTWYIAIPVTLIVLGMIWSSRMMRDSWAWLALGCLAFFGALYNWESADNHKYLIAYWALAIFWSLEKGDLKKLSFLATYLISLAFFFAVFAKLFSPDYLSGDFFRFTLLFDSRFDAVMTGLSGMSPELITENKEALRLLQSNTFEEGILQISWSDNLNKISGFLTWWTIGIELAVALCFAIPMKLFLFLRNKLLALFIVSTYSLATVVGFGWVLAIMGIAQCRENEQVDKIIFALCLLLITVYRMPWKNIVGL